MSLTKEILHELRLIRQASEFSQGEMCHTNEALRMLGLTNPRDLKVLNDMGVLPRYPRGNGFVYKKSECRELNGKLNTGEVSLPARKTQNSKAA